MYQCLEMFTQKWHVLAFLREAFTRVEGFDSLHAGVYKALHKKFKAMYTLSSPRKRLALYEVVAMHNCRSRTLRYVLYFQYF